MHPNESLLVADTEDRFHAPTDDKLFVDALQDLVGVLVCDSTDVQDGRLVNSSSLLSPSRGRSKEHNVAVPLDEHSPEAIELGVARLRFVRLEDLANGAKGRIVRVLPTACDDTEHTSAPPR